MFKRLPDAWGDLDAPPTTYDGVHWRWGRLVVSRGGLVRVIGMAALCVVMVWIAARFFWGRFLPTAVFVAVFVPGLVVGQVIHEAGHALASITRGYRVRSVFVMLGFTEVEPYRPSGDIDPRDLLWISLGGPGANVVAGALAALLGVVAGWSPILSAFVIGQISYAGNILPWAVRRPKGYHGGPWSALGFCGVATDGYVAWRILRGPRPTRV